MMPSFANTRRWTRHEVDLPVRVFARGISQAVPGRGTELGAGGMALYAGLEVQTSQTLEIEFVAASHARVAGVIRNRQGYCFGLEFVTPLAIDGEIRAASPWPGTTVPPEPGPLSRGAQELFEKIKAASGNAAAYALLARVLTLAGRHPEARKAAERSLTYLHHDSDLRRSHRQQNRQQWLRELQVLRTVMALLVDACDSEVVDPDLLRLVGTLPKLLSSDRDNSHNWYRVPEKS